MIFYYFSDFQTFFGCSKNAKCLIALKSWYGGYIAVEENGKVNAKRKKHSNLEIFEVIFFEGNKVQFKGHNNKLLRAFYNDTVDANGNGPRGPYSWKYQGNGVTWTAEYKGWRGWAFKSFRERYLIADYYGALNANGTGEQSAIDFKPIHVYGMKV